MRPRNCLQIATFSLTLGALLAHPARAGIDEWTHHGPWGGKAAALVIDPSDPDILYVGLKHGGLYKSTDGGEHWSAADNGLDLMVSITDLAIDPLSPTTLFAQTRHDGLFKTSDGGAHWLGVENTDARWPLALDPQTPGTVYAAGSGSSHLLRSTDGGANWAAADSGLPDDILAIAIDPHTPTSLYAVSNNQGVYKSLDSAATWLSVSGGFTVIEHSELVIDPQTPTTLYLAGCCEGQLFKSLDGGAHWTPINNGLASSRIVSLAIDPQAPATLYAGADDTFEATVGQVYKSTDGGANWSSVHLGPAVSSLAIDASNPSRVYAASSPHGVLRSTDSGGTWNRINHGIVATQVNSLAVGPHAPYTLFAGTYVDGIHRSLDHALTWVAAESGAAAFENITALAADPQNPDVLYAGTEFIGGSVLKSTDGGANWFDSDEGIPGSAIKSLAIDPVTPTTLYAGTQFEGVYRSLDAGAHWNTSANDLTTRTATALVIDPSEPATLYAGTRAGGVYKSTTGGVLWMASNSGLPAQPNLPQINALLLDPQDPDIVYAGGEGVFRSLDGGANWASSGLPQSIDALAIDPEIPSIVYAGGIGGVWRSTDSGASWSAFDNGLEGRWVGALAVDPEDPTFLYAGTARGGVFAIQALADQPILGLHEGRFRAEVEWRDFQGETGAGKVASVLSETANGAELRSQDSAVAQFFHSDNWEQLVKVLDGRELNGHFWVFIASATNVGLTTTVTDTGCGDVKTYTNPLGQTAPAVTDTSAFSGCADPMPAICVAEESVFCLGEDGRFQVETEWSDFVGGSGAGSQVTIPGIGLAKSDDSGLFYFFNRDNWELLVKVLDGCGINNHYWVFTAGTTNVEYTLRVTDTQSGQVKTYNNALGQDAAAVTDAGAFATCP